VGTHTRAQRSTSVGTHTNDVCDAQTHSHKVWTWIDAARVCVTSAYFWSGLFELPSQPGTHRQTHTQMPTHVRARACTPASQPGRNVAGDDLRVCPPTHRKEQSSPLARTCPPLPLRSFRSPRSRSVRIGGSTGPRRGGPLEKISRNLLKKLPKVRVFPVDQVY